MSLPLEQAPLIAPLGAQAEIDVHNASEKHPSEAVKPDEPESDEEVLLPDSEVERFTTAAIDALPAFVKFLNHHKIKPECTNRIVRKAKGR